MQLVDPNGPNGPLQTQMDHVAPFWSREIRRECCESEWLMTCAVLLFQSRGSDHERGPQCEGLEHSVGGQEKRRHLDQVQKGEVPYLQLELLVLAVEFFAYCPFRCSDTQIPIVNKKASTVLHKKHSSCKQNIANCTQKTPQNNCKRESSTLSKKLTIVSKKSCIPLVLPEARKGAEVHGSQFAAERQGY